MCLGAELSVGYVWCIAKRLCSLKMRGFRTFGTICHVPEANGTIKGYNFFPGIYVCMCYALISYFSLLLFQIPRKHKTHSHFRYHAPWCKPFRAVEYVNRIVQRFHIFFLSLFRSSRSFHFVIVFHVCHGRLLWLFSYSLFFVFFFFFFLFTRYCWLQCC